MQIAPKILRFINQPLVSVIRYPQQSRYSCQQYYNCDK
ncbi:hypothetical protein BN8_00645 [Fibrisoma limi BUZ 3]|uniref:Uncharacterized protein n=1 Tax=Fibrisoma limi BUZ 3 TaxID=1185876 RepID=I2GCS8_9BACT|nr:hypothetical protein BN8_00645 [Fibrisoma limi BUZ 3]